MELHDVNEFACKCKQRGNIRMKEETISSTLIRRAHDFCFSMVIKTQHASSAAGALLVITLSLLVSSSVDRVRCGKDGQV